MYISLLRLFPHELLCKRCLLTQRFLIRVAHPREGITGEWGGGAGDVSLSEHVHAWPMKVVEILIKYT